MITEHQSLEFFINSNICKLWESISIKHMIVEDIPIKEFISYATIEINELRIIDIDQSISIPILPVDYVHQYIFSQFLNDMIIFKCIIK
jgi:hypothetical protein